MLAFDGPGQGAALLQRGLVLRPDWENVIAPVVDYALTRPEVDPARIALIGLSLGGHLAPRAASVERRLAACIADCGAFDLHAAFLARMPGPLADAYVAEKPWARRVVHSRLHALSRKPTAGWALRRGMLVHGAADPVAFVEATREYTLAGRAEQITCPTWVCNAELDDIGASAPQLVEALTCDKTFVHFTAAEGAGDHCEAGARAALPRALVRLARPAPASGAPRKTQERRFGVAGDAGRVGHANRRHPDVRPHTASERGKHESEDSLDPPTGRLGSRHLLARPDG